MWITSDVETSNEEYFLLEYMIRGKKESFFINKKNWN